MTLREGRRGGAGRALLLLGAALPLLAFATSRLFGEDVTILVRANDAAEREEARRIRDPRDDVAEIYGQPEPGGLLRVLWPRSDRRIVPEEAPDRVLLFVDRRRGESPLQTRTFLSASYAVAAALLLLGGVLAAWARRKSSPTARRAGSVGESPGE